MGERTMYQTVIMSLVAVFGLAACGGHGTGPVSTDVAQDYCRDICEHDATCDPTTTETLEVCTADCVAEVSGFREDAFVDVASCVAAQACDASNDLCLAECTPTNAHERWEARCRTRVVECGTDNPADCITSGPSDAGILCLLTPSVMDDLTACWDQECMAIDACMGAVLDAAGIDL